MPKSRFGIVVFPGSNCDRDALFAVQDVMGQDARLIWHKEGSLGELDAVILPGGFSYGDYLRCGAIAQFSPIMKDVVRFASSGGVVIGICNGFQVLTEAGLLPGVLLRNRSLRFICRNMYLRVDSNASRFTGECECGEILRIPIAHGDGCYFAEEDALRRIEGNGQVLLRYCDRSGNVTDEVNPNGSLNNIAGVMNEAGNVMGMMPHPERAADAALGSTDGIKLFRSVIRSFELQHV